jgi:uridine phosphorylase
MSDLNRFPILANKDYQSPSVFTPENLLREAKRQKSIPEGSLPKICILDPDGDIVQNLLETGQAQPNPHWACYHTRLYNFKYDGIDFGIVGCAVGASFAVLVAEEMFASGCELLISMTSAGQIVAQGQPPYFVLIEKALRDEGTSYHYLPPAPYSEINQSLLSRLKTVFEKSSQRVIYGATWTTDAPFRETEKAIAFSQSEGIFGVEMEAAALYAFAQAKAKDVICLAQITNQMGNIENDFEKGDAGGSIDALQVIVRAARGWLELPSSK